MQAMNAVQQPTDAPSSSPPSSNPCVEEAIQLVASRDAVFFDSSALVWRSSMPVGAPIRTRLGLVKCITLRPRDGVVVCSHPSGTLYLSPLNITRTREGELVDAALVPPALPVDPLTGEEDEGDGRRPTDVDLRGCQLEHQDVARLSRALVGNHFTTALALSGNQLGDGDVALLADALAHTRCALESLLLSYNAVGALGSALLAAALRDNARLRVLDLSHNRVGPEGVRPWLGSALRANRSLLELRLSHNGIGDAKVSELLAALAPAPATREAALKAQIARRRHTTAVSPSAAGGGHEPPSDEPFNSSLETLLLADTGIGDEAARFLAHALATTRSLARLDVSCNAFGSQGVRLLARALGRNASLRALVFSDNVVEDAEVAAALLQAAGAHASLETARFQACFPSGHAAVAAAGAELLRTTQSIATLDLSHCLLEPPGAADLYRSLALNRSLRHLELMCSGLRSDGAAAALATALAENEALETLDVSYNALTLRGCKLLRDAAQAREQQPADPTGEAAGINREGYSARQRRRPLFLNLEGNSGETKAGGGPGVTVVGGLRHARPGEPAI